jgi:hypothetical protein
MATTEHASNEQMAEIMGWHLSGRYWENEDNHWVPQWVNDPDDETWDYFNPIDNLNHAALVEARLAELGLKQEYARQVFHLVYTFNPDYEALEGPNYYLITASAQTRCDAAWATWQQWKEQQT